MNKTLVEYLKGKTTLSEMSFMMPSYAGASGMMTGRQERLKQAWIDVTVKLEALWLDVMEASEDIYAEAEQALKDIRSTGPEGCKGSLPHFELLVTILQKAAETDKYCDEKDLLIYASRMNQLYEEVMYICDEFDPNIPRLPGAAFRSKEQWDRKQKQGTGKADLVFSEPGAEPEDQNGETPDEDDGDGDLDQFPDSEEGEDEDEGNFTDVDNDEGPVDAEIDSEEDSEDDEESQGFEDDQDAMASDEPAPTPGSKIPKKAGFPPKSNSIDEPSVPPKDAQDEDDDDEEDEKGRVVKKETRESTLPPATESIVIAAFSKARDAVLEAGRDFDAEFLEAAQTLRTVLEEYTDVSSAHVELGMVLPGAPPRVDVYVEWDSNGCSSDCYGFGRLVFESRQLHVLDSADRLRETIGLDVSDERLAERVYLSLETVYDVDSRRVFSESRTVPALYRLIERWARGETFPETAVANLLQGLRPRIGLHEEVRMVPQEISLCLDEHFDDVHSYFFSWSVNTPLTHLRLPDELGNSTSEPSDALQAPVAKDDFSTPLSPVSERKEGALVEHWRTPGLAVSFRDRAVYLMAEDCGHCPGDRETLDPDTTDEDVSARLASMAYQKEDVETGHLIEHAQINRRDTCRMVRTSFGVSLHEDVASLVQMSTDELWQLAVARGLKVPGDGVTWERDKLLAALSEGTLQEKQEIYHYKNPTNNREVEVRVTSDQGKGIMIVRGRRGPDDVAIYTKGLTTWASIMPELKAMKEMLSDEGFKLVRKEKTG